MKRIKVKLARKVVMSNDRAAALNRKVLSRHGVLMVNVMGSPGSGKTELIKALLSRRKPRAGWAVIEGDIASSIDAERLEGLGVPLVQMNTRGACHLSASMVGDCLKSLPLSKLHTIVVENVGNLVCPASFDLGESARLVVTALTEGPEKPTKYPGMYVHADALAIAKTDLARALKVRPDEIKRRALEINRSLETFLTSARSGKGIKELSAWIERIRQ